MKIAVLIYQMLALGTSRKKKKLHNEVGMFDSNECIRRPIL